MNKNLIKLIVCMVVLSLLIPVTCMGEEIVLKLARRPRLPLTGSVTLTVSIHDWVNCPAVRCASRSALGGQLGSNAEHWAQMNAGTLDLFAQGCDAPSVAAGRQGFRYCQPAVPV